MKKPAATNRAGSMITRAHAGGRFTAYRWPHPGQTEPAPKIACWRAFEPWQWAINTALFGDDVQGREPGSAS